MLTLKRSAARRSYHELESLDYETGELVSRTRASTISRSRGERPTLRRNHWFLADPLLGACACFGAPPGPATLVGFTELDAPRSGLPLHRRDGRVHRDALAGDGHALRGVPLPPRARTGGLERWARAGANHHSSATPGDLGEAVERSRAFLGVEAVRV